MPNESIDSKYVPLLGLQMLFVVFGALVLVPILTGLNPSVALFTAGAGTLLFQLIPGGKFRSFWHLRLPLSHPLFMAFKLGVSPQLCLDSLRRD